MCGKIIILLRNCYDAKVPFTDDLWIMIFELVKPYIDFLRRKQVKKFVVRFSVFSTFQFRIVRFVRKCLNTQTNILQLFYLLVLNSRVLLRLLRSNFS